jgi:hypothetical protein
MAEGAGGTLHKARFIRHPSLEEGFAIEPRNFLLEQAVYSKAGICLG